MTNITIFEELGISELARSNLHGQPLRVAAVMSHEYAYDTDVVQNLDGTINFRDSFAVELLRALEVTMNFTTIPVLTTFWGHRLPNGSWVGMIPLLLENKADIGLSSIADRPFRREVVDFNMPTNEIRLSAFFQRPPSISSHYGALIKPFSISVWISILLLLVAMITSAIILNKVLRSGRLEVNSSSFNSSSQPLTVIVENSICSQILTWIMTLFSGNGLVPTSWVETIVWSVSDCVMWSLTAVSLRGFYKSPIENSLRILMMAGSVAGVVLFAAYSGTLVSFLSVTIEPINNLGQLLATDFTFVVIDYELPLKFLSESPDAKGVQLYQRRKTDKSYGSMKEAYDEINRGSFAFIMDSAGATETLTTDFETLEACRIREIEIENGRQKQGTLVQKSSKYKRIIDYQILKTIQYGLVKRWSNKYFKKIPVCEDASKYEGVDFLSSSLAFSILAIFGWMLGLIGFLIENWTHKRRKSRVLMDEAASYCANEFVLD